MRRGKTIFIALIAAFSLANAGCIANEDTPTETANKNTLDQSNPDGDLTISIETLMNCTSERTNLSCAIYVDDYFSALVATSIAIYYDQQGNQHKTPLIFDGEHKPYMTEFLKKYEKYSIGSDIEKSSIESASRFWNKSDCIMVVENSFNGYCLGTSATVIASYLNIPIIVGASHFDDMARELGIKYAIEVGDISTGMPSFQLKSQEDVDDLSIGILKNIFGGVYYIAVTNPNDVNCTWGVQGASCLVPYIAAYHKGVVSSTPMETLPTKHFGEQPSGIDPDNLKEQPVDPDKPNNIASLIKTHLLSITKRLDEVGILSTYLQESPYLGIIGDAFTVPFYYYMDGIWSPPDYPTDDYYCDILGNESEHMIELASGRLIASSTPSISELIARTVFYYHYMPIALDDSQLTLKNSAWSDNCFVFTGDDSNGAIVVALPDYLDAFKYFNNHNFNARTTVAAGGTLAQNLLKLCSSSNYIYGFIHGSKNNLNNVDKYESEKVRTWNMGPSVIILISCSAARIDDWSEAKNKDCRISMAFMDAGINAYIGGMRSEGTQSMEISRWIAEGLMEQNLSCGLSLKNAKNNYTNTKTEEDCLYNSAIKILYGDPAFNPYEPCNEGGIK